MVKKTEEHNSIQKSQLAYQGTICQDWLSKRRKKRTNKRVHSVIFMKKKNFKKSHINPELYFQNRHKCIISDLFTQTSPVSKTRVCAQSSLCKINVQNKKKWVEWMFSETKSQ